MRAEGKNVNLKVMKYYTIIQAVIHLNYGAFSICGCLKRKPHDVRMVHVQYSLNGDRCCQGAAVLSGVRRSLAGFGAY